jgi:hypothetical protein
MLMMLKEEERETATSATGLLFLSSPLSLSNRLSILLVRSLSFQVMAAKSPKLIDGNAIAATLHAEIAAKVASIVEKTNGSVVPCLSVIHVGSRTDSSTYVRMKQRTAEKLGLRFNLVHFEDNGMYHLYLLCEAFFWSVD